MINKEKLMSSSAQQAAVPEAVERQTFKAEVHTFTKSEGGRHTPFFTNYRPTLLINSGECAAVCKKIEGTEIVMPGDDVVIIFELQSRVQIYYNDEFTIIDGDKTVGKGVVKEIL